MTRPWRVVAPDGTIVATSSTFSEAEIAHRDGDTLQQLDTQHEWQDASLGESPAEGASATT
jgi:hypothetical protein